MTTLTAILVPRRRPSGSGRGTRRRGQGMALAAGRPRAAARPVADGLRALPLMVFGFLVVDLVGTVVARAYGVPNSGRAGASAVVQMVLVVLTAAALLWARPRLAVPGCVLVALLVLLLGPSGAEDWVVLVSGVVVAVRASRRRLVLGGVALLGYPVVFGVSAQTRNGYGAVAALTVLALVVVAFGCGLVARRLLHARDGNLERLAVLEEQTGRIRADERSRLADELQTLLTEGLDALGSTLRADPRTRPSAAALRSRLDAAAATSRHLLSQLRVLLGVLRQDAEPNADFDPAPVEVGRRRWIDLLTARSGRLAVVGLTVLLGLRALVEGLGTGPDVGLAVHLLALAAVGTGVLRPRAGALVAALALVVAALGLSRSSFDLVAVAFLGVAGAFLATRFRVLVVLLGLVAYAGLRVLVGPDEPTQDLAAIAYTGLAALLVGLVVHHLVRSRQETLGQTAALLAHQERVTTEERNAVARELHDVVAHQLSVVSLLVLAAPDDDVEELGRIVERLRQTTESARRDLGTLLHALRGAEADQSRPGAEVTPSAAAAALAERLAENGHRVESRIDPRGDALDPTTRRTLVRIMQEATTNALRYAPAGTRCAFALTVEPGAVRVEVTSALGTGRARSDLSLGWGLRGLRERVDLTGGTFTAGRRGGDWAVGAVLPVEAVTPLAAGVAGSA